MMAQFRQEIDTMEVDHVAIIRKATVQKSEKGKKVQRKKWDQKEKKGGITEITHQSKFKGW